jgi:WLM domain
MGTPRRRRRNGYYEVAGVDLEREMARLCALELFGGSEGELARRPPRLDVRRSSKRPRRNLGFAVPDERRISVTAYPGIRPGDVQETLLHELVHIALGRHDGGWHGRRFRSALKAAMREAYGITGVAARASTHGTYAEALERRRRVRRPGVEPHPGQLALDTAA